MNRTIDEQLLMDLADQVGFHSQQNRGHSVPAGQNSPSHGDPQAQAREIAESMKGKSDAEILSEIMKLKATLQKNPAAYEKQIRAVKSLRGMMNPEQRKRLDHVLQLLER
ncbi:MAG: hypothetical protein IJ486_01610 [Firmicutes bacterium]|nr:hypothetical protein [Bacillota bacterium]